MAKALFLGGVTRRFPDLRFAFLEGGVGWGCQLFCDLIEHWERRGAKGLANMDPTKLDRKLLRELVDKYGYADIGAELDRRDGWPMKEEDSLTGGVPLDDYHFCKISQKQDWIDLFATPYYFGCEADDRMNAVAFGKMMPLGARINALFSSDIGHFDVVDMRDPLPEAYELVEDGHITESDFSDFVFGNAVRLWGTQNPRFFEGTRVAKEAAALLKASYAGARGGVGELQSGERPVLAGDTCYHAHRARCEWVCWIRRAVTSAAMMRLTASTKMVPSPSLCDGPGTIAARSPAVCGCFPGKEQRVIPS